MLTPQASTVSATPGNRPESDLHTRWHGPLSTVMGDNAGARRRDAKVGVRDRRELVVRVVSRG